MSLAFLARQALGLVLVVSSLLLAPAHAGPGHDHGHDHGGAPTPAGPALPRFAAVSEAFELVGVLDGRRLTLYLDRAADNTPVTGATLELELGGTRLQARAQGEVYEAELPAAPAPGVLAVTATITAGQEVDLLAGELDLHATDPGADDAHAHGWRAYAGWVAGTLIAVLALIALTLIGRRVAARRHARTGAAA